MSLDVVCLGFLQGLTEFLPVSSSGHLGLLKALFGMDGPTLAFDLVLHMATLFAVLIYFARDIFRLVAEWACGFFNRNAHDREGWRFGWAVVVGTFVTAPIGLVLKPFAERASVNFGWIGINLWLTALLLFSARLVREGRENVRTPHGLPVGFAQGLAVMPGLSRSGATIWTGILCGLSKEEAFRFSFLLSVPAILGATLYEARDLGGADAFLYALPPGWIWGALASFISGLASLVLLRKLVTGDRWWLFSFYCMAVGSIAVILSKMGA